MLSVMPVTVVIIAYMLCRNYYELSTDDLSSLNAAAFRLFQVFMEFTSKISSKRYARNNAMYVLVEESVCRVIFF